MNPAAKAYDDDNKDFLLIFLPKIRIPWKWEKVRILCRSFQALMGFVILLVVSSVDMQSIQDVNYLYYTDSYKFLIANGVLIWIYATVTLLVEVESINAQIPQQLYEIFDGKGSLVEMAGDFIFNVFCFSGALAALDALYTSVCGGNFQVDECFSMEDVCKMALRNNARFEGFACPVGRLKAASVMTFLMMPFLILTFIAAWRNFRGAGEVHEPLHERYRDQANEDEGSRRNSLGHNHAEESWSMMKDRDLASDEHADIYRAQGAARSDSKIHDQATTKESSLMQEVDPTSPTYEDV
mmetsp:Transcript_7598/g.10117  ORF Transcript_7598/g.10117 Transcript_7598/m.10117 type:complete len:297 (+) Transcript_7598:55-945(+)